MRKTPFVIGEYYHVYNRGVDKRNVFSDRADLARFFLSMKEFNTLKPIGSIYERMLEDRNLGENENAKKVRFGHPMSKSEKLVNFVCYCLNPNHYHFILEPLVDHGIEKFMQRLGNGYTKYFNTRYKRTGVLFQGKFRSIHIDSNEYLLHLSAYVNLNNRFGKEIPELSKSSWDEYIKNQPKNFCGKDIVLVQFDSPQLYKEFAESSLEDILRNKEQDKELRKLLLE